MRCTWSEGMVMPAMTPHQAPPLRQLGLHFIVVTVFNVLCAALITWGLKMGGDFRENLVYSLCIGTLALLFIDGGRLLLWRGGRAQLPGFMLLTICALPAAQFLGSLAAGALLGIPRRHALPGSSGYPVALLIFTMMAGVATTWFFYSRGRMASLAAEAEAEKARAAAQERLALQAQLQMLQAQIEPHMLFNTLANLQGLIAIDPPRAAHLLEQLIVYLRAALDAARAAQTTLDAEFALLQAYLELMSVRMGSRLAYALDLPPELRGVAIAPMLLQPLVENAIRHGLEPKIEGGRIDIRAAREDGMLLLSVADTGLGLEAPAQHGSRMALANIDERLRALYGDAARFTLHPNAPCGAIAEIRIAMP
jgi:signal transduction histidine kinase